MSHVKILIVDDESCVRMGTRLTLVKDKAYKVVGEAANGTDGLELVAQHKPDLVTLDVQMPGISMETFVEDALRIHPELKILVVSSLEDQLIAKRIEALPVSGYLVKAEALEYLSEAVGTVLQGQTWFSPSIASKMRLS